MRTATATSRRLAGIDLARALAIIGMLMVHVGPTHREEPAGVMYALPHGRASVLFMLLAGIGVSLLAASRRPVPGGITTQLAWRGLLLLPLGLALQVIATGQLVILATYALVFVMAIGLVRLSDRGILVLAGIMAVAGPTTFLVGQMHAPAVFNRRALELGQPAGEIAHGLLLSGPYPLITWIVPFLFGLWLGRCDLRAAATRRRLVFGGVGAAVALTVITALLQGAFGKPGFAIDWIRLLSLEPHSQMPPWLWSATATAAAALGLCLVIADRAGRLVWPLVALGQVALTFYVGHLLLLAWWPTPLTSGDPATALRLAAIIVAHAAALAVAWRWLFARGPLEFLLQLPATVLARYERGAGGALDSRKP